MKLKKLQLKNIRSYEDQTIDFPEGSLLLAGDVGSGKTTLLLAIEYALFGLQPGQKGAALLRTGAETGEVSLELEIEEQEIKIERHLRRESKSITSDYAAITYQGDTQELSVTELKSRILDLLGYPAEFIKKNNLLYRYTVYTPQEQMKQIILEDIETRLNVLRHVFGIDKYKRIRENLVFVISRLKEESKVLQGEIKTMEHDKIQQTVLQEKVQKLESEVRAKSNDFVAFTSQRQICETGLTELESNIREKRNLEKEVEKATILITLKQENLAVLTKEQTEIQQSLSEAGPSFDQNRYDDCLVKLKDIQELLESYNTQYISLLSSEKSYKQTQKNQEEKKDRVFKIDMCPTCLQDVPEVHKHNILNETENNLVDIKKKLKEIEEQKDNLLQTISLKKKEKIVLEQNKLDLEILRSKIFYIEKSKQRLNETIQRQEILQRDIGLLVNHSERLKNEILKLSKFDLLYKVKNEDLEKARKLEKNAEITIAELNKEIQITHKDQETLSKIIGEKEVLAKKVRRLSNILDWLTNQFQSLITFTEIQVMMKLRREFSRVFNTWFHMVAGEAFEVQLDENFTPIIMQGDVEMDYAFLSGGERTAVALAYRLALNQTINSLLSNIKTKDLVILDEPTDGFSEAQIDKIRDVLEELNVKQLIIVSHEQKIESFVDNIVRLKKANDISSIEVGTLSPVQPTE